MPTARPLAPLTDELTCPVDVTTRTPRVSTVDRRVRLDAAHTAHEVLPPRSPYAPSLRPVRTQPAAPLNQPVAPRTQPATARIRSAAVRTQPAPSPHPAAPSPHPARTSPRPCVLKVRVQHVVASPRVRLLHEFLTEVRTDSGRTVSHGRK